MARVTLKDVAARAGVSYQTVSKVLNKQAQVASETEARIWSAVAALGYRPNISARNLRTQETNLIGYGWSHTPGSYFHPVLDRFLHSVAYAAESRGYHLLTFLVPEEDRTNLSAYMELFARRQVDGFVLANTIQNDPRIANLLENRIPFASFGQANEAWDFHWVDVDGRHGIELAMAHLLRAGHTRIAFISWPEGSQSGYHREQGYLSRLQAAGISLEAEWLRRGVDSAQTGALVFADLMALPAARRPTAVVCVSDLIAIGVMNAAAAAGLEPGRDIAIIGFDDVPMAEFLHPPLTTVQQPIPEIGEFLIEMLLSQLNGTPAPSKSILLKPELVIRKSG
jgi:DNA-binding LacI/PurR family transcriptional regulator